MNLNEEDGDIEMESNKRVKREKEDLIVDTPNHLEVETFIHNYQGHTLIKRLRFIAKHCPSQRIEALKQLMKISYEKTPSVYLKIYQEFQEYFEDATEELPHIQPNEIEKIQEKIDLRKRELEHELKLNKANMIKETIRMCYDDLGYFYYQIGDMKKSLTQFLAMKNYCSTNLHLLDLSLRILMVHFQMEFELTTDGQFSNAMVNFDSIPSNIQQDKKTHLDLLHGLFHLLRGNYVSCMKYLITIDYDTCLKFPQYLSPTDLLIYVALCALSCSDYHQIRLLIKDNARFRKFLELEPEIEEMLDLAAHFKYRKCLDLLESWKNDFLLDIFVSPQWEDLYSLIQRNFLKDFLKPYCQISLSQIHEEFSVLQLPMLESLLILLISSNDIPFRYDSDAKTLILNDVDVQSETITEISQNLPRYERLANAYYIRNRLLESTGMEDRVQSGEDENDM